MNRPPRAAYLITLLGALYFLVPLIATVEFSLRQGHGRYGLSSYGDVFRDPDFRHYALKSLLLAAETTTAGIALLLPTAFWVHLRLPRLRGVMETLTILPFVVPPIVLVVGLERQFRDAPAWVTPDRELVGAYVILAFPYIYRSLDSGLRAVDLRTLVEASQSLGAPTWKTLLLVIVPNLRAALLSAALLSITLVLGEFTIASLLLDKTFPTYISGVGLQDPFKSTALTVIAFASTFVGMLALILLTRSRRLPAATRVGPGGAV